MTTKIGRKLRGIKAGDMINARNTVEKVLVEYVRVIAKNRADTHTGDNDTILRVFRIPLDSLSGHGDCVEKERRNLLSGGVEG